MNTLLKPLLVTILGSLKSRAELQLEVLAHRQQLAMMTERDHKRLRMIRHIYTYCAIATVFTVNALENG